MRIEDKVTETMRRATATEPLPRDVWDAFERRAVRARRTRVVATSLSLAAIVALGALVIPHLGKQKKVDVVRPVTLLRTYHGHSFAVDYPEGWRVQEDFRGVELLPPGRNDGVRIELTHVTYSEGPCRSECLAHPFNDALRGRAFSQFEYTSLPGELAYSIDWLPHRTLQVSYATDSRVPLTVVFERIARSVRPDSSQDGPPANWKTYTNKDGSWQLAAPRDWEVTNFEAQADFHPHGLSSLAKGEATYSVSLLTLPEAFDKGVRNCADNSGNCDSIDTSEDLFGGRRYVQKYENLEGGGRILTYRVDWSTHCAAGTFCPFIQPRTLQVVVMASTRELDMQFTKIGDGILHSIEYL